MRAHHRVIPLSPLPPLGHIWDVMMVWRKGNIETWLTNRHSSELWHCWLGHLTRKIVSEMTCNVSSGTLDTTIPYQECTVADDVPSRAEDCTFPVVVWQWLGDRDCTAQYNCCVPATTDCRRFCCFVFFSFFLFNFIRCPCNVLDVIVSP